MACGVDCKLKIAVLNGVERFFQNEAARFRHFNDHDVHMDAEAASFPVGCISPVQAENSGDKPRRAGSIQRLRPGGGREPQCGGGR